MRLLRIQHLLLSLLAGATVLLSSCRKEEEIIRSQEEQVGKEAKTGPIQGFFLLNEANMGSNKSTLDYYDYKSGKYTRNIYAERNPNVVKELGDVGNDLQIYGERLYAVINVSHLIEVMDGIVAELDPAAPWEHPRAKEWDSISFKQWLKEQSDDEEARKNIGLFIAGGMLTKPDHAFSALQAFHMAASAGSFTNLVDEDFILDARVVGGMQSVSLKMAEEIGEDNIILSSPVRTLEYTDEGVTLHADNDVVVRAQYCILAVPPNLYNRISYVPELPRTQHIMHQHQSMGLVIKVHATYATPFWRDKGLSGTCFSSNHLVQEIYDNTNHGDERGTLVGFVVDEKAEEMFALPEEERKRTILEAMAKMLGEETLNPESFYLSDWGAEEWTRGAYACSYDLGGLARWGKYNTVPVGPIHFACSDIAGEGYQHVDGAVRMGHKVSGELIERLGG